MTYQNNPTILTPKGVGTDGDVSIVQPLKDHVAIQEIIETSMVSITAIIIINFTLLSALLDAMTIFPLSLSLSLSLSDVYKT